MRKTKDGQLILMHDATVDRTTDGTGAITNLTLAEIKQLHLKLGVGGTNAAVTDQRVPTLEEVMLLAKDKCMVNLDKAWIIVPECCAVLKKTGTTPAGHLQIQLQRRPVRSGLCRPEPARVLHAHHPPQEGLGEEEGAGLGATRTLHAPDPSLRL